MKRVYNVHCTKAKARSKMKLRPEKFPYFRLQSDEKLGMGKIFVIYYIFISRHSVKYYTTPHEKQQTDKPNSTREN